MSRAGDAHIAISAHALHAHDLDIRVGVASVAATLLVFSAERVGGTRLVVGVARVVATLCVVAVVVVVAQRTTNASSSHSLSEKDAKSGKAGAAAPDREECGDDPSRWLKSIMSTISFRLGGCVPAFAML